MKNKQRVSFKRHSEKLRTAPNKESAMKKEESLNPPVSQFDPNYQATKTTMLETEVHRRHLTTKSFVSPTDHGKRIAKKELRKSIDELSLKADMFNPYMEFHLKKCRVVLNLDEESHRSAQVYEKNKQWLLIKEYNMKILQAKVNADKKYELPSVCF